MALGTGKPDVVIGLLDGPVDLSHPRLAEAAIRCVTGVPSDDDGGSGSAGHATFIAGMWVASGTKPAPAICPGCSVVVRPIFGTARRDMTTPEVVAEAIRQCADEDARVVNLSAAVSEPSTRTASRLSDALDMAARRGILVVAAAGNQGTLGSSMITRHPWVIPVVAYDAQLRPMRWSNLGRSLARGGVGAPGQDLQGLGLRGAVATMAGTSVAAAFVTGAVALLWSHFPSATPTEMRYAVTRGGSSALRSTVVPPLLDAWSAYRWLNRRSADASVPIAKGGDAWGARLIRSGYRDSFRSRLSDLGTSSSEPRQWLESGPAPAASSARSV